MGHVPSDLTRAPKGQHGNLLSPFFLGFILHLGPLWPVTSEATVAPLPLYSSNMGLRSACAHEEIVCSNVN